MQEGLYCLQMRKMAAFKDMKYMIQESAMSTPGPNEREWWRAESLNTLMFALAYQLAQGHLSSITFDEERRAIQRACRDHNDSSLLAYLRKYAPDAPHLAQYPG
jgi:hypothetical protein